MLRLFEERCDRSIDPRKRERSATLGSRRTARAEERAVVRAALEVFGGKQLPSIARSIPRALDHRAGARRGLSPAMRRGPSAVSESKYGNTSGGRSPYLGREYHNNWKIISLGD